MTSQASQQSLVIKFLKELGKHKITKLLLRLIILSLVSGGAYAVYHQTIVMPRQEAKHQAQTVAVERLSLPITIAANGTVQPEKSINVSPKTAGVLKSLLVKEGDRVKQGQILAYMDDSNLQGQLIEAQGRLAAAQANLQQSLAGNRPEDIAQTQEQLTEVQANLQKLLAGNRPEDIAQAQARLNNALAQLQQAEDDFRRNQELANAGAISLQSLNQARTTRDSAQAQVMEVQQALALAQAGPRSEEVAQARAQVRQKQQALALAQAGPRSEEVAQARAQVTQAQGAVQTIQAQINDTVIRAAFDGAIARKFADPGAFVTPTTAGSSVSSATSSSIMSLVANNQVVAYVAESNISQIRLGQEVILQADAYPRKTFAGQVTQIATQSITQQNVTSFEVKIVLLSDAQQLLRSGMNVNVEFKVGELKNALVVPTVAIVRQENNTGVFVTQGNRTLFTPIVTGVTANHKTEVLSGLKGEERIFVSFPKGFRPQSMVPTLGRGS
ncbi:biotin/lipoyl-binding protein [Gloeocapsopsis crepidinum LEGE 06123]|uniref:Biotin/lipoyl-binding protein n=1 Tax=Gloeocapsopsis crepidinum LEGE 06123 TaxID=588587 RepID=A0ABR9ULE1_9CHRO|nr:biotin/lipoyl-binding protein [Gloeocapsopsis crepidinum]MBE9189107.1 biotin/lipoyl-binding protein [Gloeocapsopsis crepidinum LEGE 06123]